MKLPQVGRGQVESLGRENVQLAASAAAAPYKAGAAIADTAAKVADDFQLLREQERSLQLYKEEKAKRRAITDAIDPVTGKVNVDALPDDVRTQYMTSNEAATSGDYDNDVFIDDQRFTDMHKIQPIFDEYFAASELKAKGRPKTYRESKLYEQRDNGEAERFREQLGVQAKKSVIESTVNASVEEVGFAAQDRDVAGVNDQLDFLRDSGYLDPNKVDALKSEAYGIIRQQIQGDLVELQADASVLAFEGDKAALALESKQWKSIVSQAVTDGIITQEEGEQAVYEYDLEIETQTEMGVLKSLYDGKGRDVANKYLDKKLRDAGKPSDQNDEYKIATKLITYYNQLDRNYRTKNAADKSEIFELVKGYVTITTDKGDATWGDNYANREATRGYLYDRIENSALDPAEKKKLVKQIKQADRLTDMYFKTTAEFTEQYNIEMSTGTTDLSNYKDRAQFRQLAIARDKAIKKDPLGFYVKATGLQEDAIAFNMADPANSMLRLSKRAREATAYTGVNTSPVPYAVAEQIKVQIAEGTFGLQQQLGFMAGVSALPDDQALAVSRTFFETDNYSMAVGAMVLRETGDAEQVRGLLMGAETLRVNPDFLPNSIAGEGTLQQQFAGTDLFKATAGMPQMQSAFLEAAKAQYMFLNGNNPVTSYDSNLIADSVNFVSGGIVSVGSDALPTLAPFRGATDDQFDDGVNNITIGDLKEMGLADAGVLPDEEVLERVKHGSRWIPLTNGRYHLEVPTMNGYKVLSNTDGEPFVLDWSMIGSAPREVGSNDAATSVSDIQFGAL